MSWMLQVAERQHLSAMTNTSDGHLPSHDIMTNLCIILIQLIERADLEEEYDISVLLLDLPVLLL